MKIMIGIGHPKQVHIWKNIVKNLISNGHEIKILATDKDITQYLLDINGIEYTLYDDYQKSLTKKAYHMVFSTIKMIYIAKYFKPDLFIAGTPYLAIVSKIFRKPHVTLSDTEHASLTYWLTYPFTDVICTPQCFKKPVNPKKHRSFSGYFELAYLHPTYFEPDPTVLDEIGLDKSDQFIILRFVAWDASHDVGHHGFNALEREKMVKSLEKHSKVFITSESKIEKNLEKYMINISPEKMHSLLYYATMYIGEGGAMAAEAGILGTPSIYVSSLAGTMGNFDELEQKYGLVYSYKDPKIALEKALDLLSNDNLKNEWKTKRMQMLSEKTDVTRFMIKFIEEFTTTS